MLIVFDNMMADMKANKKLIHMACELFTRGSISLVFITTFYFKLAKDISLKVTPYQPHQIIKNFRKLYKDYPKKRFSFLVNDASTRR